MQSIAALSFIALPWLNPFAPGPSPAVVPWLVALAATAALVLSASLRTVSGEALGGESFTRRWVGPAACAWMLAGLVSSLMGLLQYFDAAAAFGAWVNQAALGEAFANLRQRNQFASLTNIALTALVWFASQRGLLARPRQWLVLVAAGLLMAGNASSSSRTGLMQLVLLCTLLWVWGAWRQPFVRRVLLTAGLAYALAAWALPWLAGFDPAAHGMLARLRTGDPACFSRLTLWSNVLTLIAQKPWFGWGWGELDYAHYMTLYPGARFCDILDNAHNLPLHLAVELGIPVALLVCGISAWLVLRVRPWREADPTRQLAWSVLALIFLHSLLEYPLWYGPFQMAFVLCIGLLWRPGSGAVERLEYKRNRRLAPVSVALTATIFIVIGIYAAWDYHRISQIYLPLQSRDSAYRDNPPSKIRGSWLFREQVLFAELSITPLTQNNASWTLETATALLHYSPEPRVIEKAIESALMLGREDEALAHLARYRAAFPAEHAHWVQANAQVPERLQRLK